MAKAEQLPLSEYVEYPLEQMKQRAAEFFEEVRRRRSVRQFSDRPVPQSIIEDCIRAAGSAPSGANRQPWHFVVVSNPDVKRKIRTAAEQVEHEFYDNAAPDAWLQALEPIGTDEHKPYLEIAPYLIVVFIERFGLAQQSEKEKNYYALESVGIATGVLITALHHAGLASLVHTPSPMQFLQKLLGRPDNERPFLIVVAGYPADDATVPDLQRKSIAQISTFI